MEFFKTNDGCRVAYRDVGLKSQPLLILVGGPTSSQRARDLSEDV
jgi:hypothetical protein